MTLYVWSLTDGIYRLRPEGGPPGSSVVSLWLERRTWHWEAWRDGEVIGRSYHYDHASILPNAKRRAVEYARRLGVIKGEDEVMG